MINDLDVSKMNLAELSYWARVATAVLKPACVHVLNGYDERCMECGANEAMRRTEARIEALPEPQRTGLALFYRVAPILYPAGFDFERALTECERKR